MPESGNGVPSAPQFDALIPAAMARKAERVGEAKARLDVSNTFLLAVLAGAFIALGGAFFIVVVSDSTLGHGPTRLLGGLAFCTGLVLVVVAGAELFTGNNLIVMAWASGRVSTAAMFRNWIIVYAGNFAGAVATAYLVFLAGVYSEQPTLSKALEIGRAKVQLGFLAALSRGVLCNALVCLAIWTTFSARTIAGRIITILFPISAFVTIGFEHSVANMFFVPLALLLSGLPSTEGSSEVLTWGAFLVDNLLPVTIGNIIGGSLLVGAVYWVVYLRGERDSVS